MKKLVLLLSLLVLLLGMVVSSDAMSKKGGDKKGMGGMEMGMCDERMMMKKFASLGLDDRQKEDIKAIHLRIKKDMIRKKADIGVAQVELREVLSKDTVDLQAAEAKVKQIESLKAEMKITHIRTHEEVKSKLTPEQRKKFSAMHGMGCMECGMGGGMHKMKGGMGMKGKCGKMKDMDDDDMPVSGPQHH
jgi:Spy/CpxP family protein refolding chaperone